MQIYICRDRKFAGGGRGEKGLCPVICIYGTAYNSRKFGRFRSGESSRNCCDQLDWASSKRFSPEQRTNERQSFRWLTNGKACPYLKKVWASKRISPEQRTNERQSFRWLSNWRACTYLPKEGLSLKENLPGTADQWETLFQMIVQWEACTYLKKVWASKRICRDRASNPKLFSLRFR